MQTRKSWRMVGWFFRRLFVGSRIVARCDGFSFFVGCRELSVVHGDFELIE